MVPSGWKRAVSERVLEAFGRRESCAGTIWESRLEAGSIKYLDDSFEERDGSHVFESALLDR